MERDEIKVIWPEPLTVGGRRRGGGHLPTGWIWVSSIELMRSSKLTGSHGVKLRVSPPRIKWIEAMATTTKTTKRISNKRLRKFVDTFVETCDFAYAA